LKVTPYAETVFVVIIVVNLVEHTFNPFPARSFILFEWNIMVYCVPCANSDVGVIFNVLPVMVDVNGIAVPLLFINCIPELFPY
jgi:hypothetical protein